MAREISKVFGNKFGEFIMGGRTDGCFSGNAEILKKECPGIGCCAIEPFHVCALSGGDISGKHKLEGIDAGFVPKICRLDLTDEIIAVRHENAYATAPWAGMGRGDFRRDNLQRKCLGSHREGQGPLPREGNRQSRRGFRPEVPERGFVQADEHPPRFPLQLKGDSRGFGSGV